MTSLTGEETVAPLTSAVAALQTLCLAGDQLAHASAKRDRIGAVDALALSHLAAGGSLSPGQLAVRVSLTPSSTTTLLDRLEAAELAERQPDPKDRRKVMVGVTPAGQQLVDALETRLGGVFDGYTEQQLVQLAQDLETLAKRLSTAARAIRREPRGRDYTTPQQSTAEL